MSSPGISITTYILTTPQQVWDALTNAEVTERYWGGTRIESDWRVGSKVFYRRNGAVVDEHVLLSFEPTRRMSYAFHPVFAEEFRRERPSRVSFEIAPLGEVVQLTVTHDDFPENSAVYRACRVGWPMIISSLKTLLETGTRCRISNPRTPDKS